MRLGTGEREASSWVRAFCRRGPRICKRRDSGGWISARRRLRVTGGLGSDGGDRSAEVGCNGRDWRGVRGFLLQAWAETRWRRQVASQSRRRRVVEAPGARRRGGAGRRGSRVETGGLSARGRRLATETGPAKALPCGEDEQSRKGGLFFSFFSFFLLFLSPLTFSPFAFFYRRKGPPSLVLFSLNLFPFDMTECLKCVACFFNFVRTRCLL